MEYTKNIGENVKSVYERSSTMHKLILFAVIVVLIYFIYTLLIKKTDEMILLRQQSGKEPTVISKTKVPQVGSSNYSMSVWFYINEWSYQYGKEKNVVARYVQDKNETDSKQYKPVPSITLDANTNDLLVKLSYYSPNKASKKNEIKVHECKIHGVPLQRWTYVNIVVHNRTLDVYIDGKLNRTCVIEGVPLSGIESDIFVSSSSYVEQPGFSGSISDLKLYTYAMNPNQVYNQYRKGNSISSVANTLDKYKLKFALLENNKEKSSYII